MPLPEPPPEQTPGATGLSALIGKTGPAWSRSTGKTGASAPASSTFIVAFRSAKVAFLDTTPHAASSNYCRLSLCESAFLDTTPHAASSSYCRVLLSPFAPRKSAMRSLAERKAMIPLFIITAANNARVGRGAEIAVALGPCRDFSGARADQTVVLWGVRERSAIYRTEKGSTMP